MDNLRVPLLLFLVLIISDCSGQPRQVDRQPAVAGQFYPGTREELRTTLAGLFADAPPSQRLPGIRAIIVPHAGYVFSGPVAAAGFKQIDTARQYDNIFIVGPSHHVGFEGASVYTQGDFVTPLGTVEVNRKLGAELIARDPLFSSRFDAQAAEHSVEVEVPFLQHLFGKPFRIVPIVVGANSPETCRGIARTLKPYLTARNLFVISSDFSHYPPAEDATEADARTAEAIVSGQPGRLLGVMAGNEKVPGLATSLCGWSAVLTLLDMASSDSGYAFTKILYRNSGDVPGGDRGHVVGYWAIVLSLKPSGTSSPPTPPEESFRLSPEDRKLLLSLARQAVERSVAGPAGSGLLPASLPPALSSPCGAFVTLYKNHELRGCIGRFDPGGPLYRVVQEMGAAAATQDYRFPQVAPSELHELQIEVSVLTPLRRIRSLDEFQLGRHGLYLKKDGRSGTFLPQVAGETGWTKEEFFGHCARDKAGIGWDGWKDAELFVYEAVVFSE
jgi:AmmeMemoRadiSam system protein B/AmmeMemoRadiSam system protein A